MCAVFAVTSPSIFLPTCSGAPKAGLEAEPEDGLPDCPPAARRRPLMRQDPSTCPGGQKADDVGDLLTPLWEFRLQYFVPLTSGDVFIVRITRWRTGLPGHKAGRKTGHKAGHKAGYKSDSAQQVHYRWGRRAIAPRVVRRPVANWPDG